jgi:hypothetical protein
MNSEIRDRIPISECPALIGQDEFELKLQVANLPAYIVKPLILGFWEFFFNGKKYDEYRAIVDLAGSPANEPISEIIMAFLNETRMSLPFAISGRFRFLNEPEIGVGTAL